MSLTPKQVNVIRLIHRSKIGDNGWYSVSRVVWPLVDGALPDDLVELRPTGNGGFIRFTMRGQAVADYI
jgi:hypothetical protein